MEREEAIETLKQHHDYLGRDWAWTKECLQFGISEINKLNDLENLLIQIALFQGTVKADWLIQWLYNWKYTPFATESGEGGEQDAKSLLKHNRPTYRAIHSMDIRSNEGSEDIAKGFGFRDGHFTTCAY